MLRKGIFLTLEGEERRRLAREGEEDLVEHSMSDSLYQWLCQFREGVRQLFREMQHLLWEEVVVRFGLSTLPI